MNCTTINVLFVLTPVRALRVTTGTTTVKKKNWPIPFEDGCGVDHSGNLAARHITVAETSNA
ncbi:MAG TPA: hypothetical protein ACHBX0_09170 [Arsenophonus sp.]